MPANSSIPCSKDVRDRLRSMKRGGQTYDEILTEMIDQYEPKDLDQIEIL